MTTFREVLRPSWWMYLIAGFMIPTTILVMAPFNFEWGIVLAIIIYLSIIIPMIITSPSISLTEEELRVGKAHIERKFIGGVSAYSGTHAIAARGTELDARAWVYLRGWINPVVRVENTDPNDPTPYWLFSTRKPEDLVAALRSGRSQSK